MRKGLWFPIKKGSQSPFVSRRELLNPPETNQHILAFRVIGNDGIRRVAHNAVPRLGIKKAEISTRSRVNSWSFLSMPPA
mgnify:CR=1 FL=1